MSNDQKKATENLQFSTDVVNDSLQTGERVQIMSPRDMTYQSRLRNDGNIDWQKKAEEIIAKYPGIAFGVTQGEFENPTDKTFYIYRSPVSQNKLKATPVDVMNCLKELAICMKPKKPADQKEIDNLKANGLNTYLTTVRLRVVEGSRNPAHYQGSRDFIVGLTDNNELKTLDVRAGSVFLKNEVQPRGGQKIADAAEFTSALTGAHTQS